MHRNLTFLLLILFLGLSGCASLPTGVERAVSAHTGVLVHVRQEFSVVGVNAPVGEAPSR